jgi:hypothetical protein
MQTKKNSRKVGGSSGSSGSSGNPGSPGNPGNPGSPGSPDYSFGEQPHFPKRNNNPPPVHEKLFTSNHYLKRIKNTSTGIGRDHLGRRGFKRTSKMVNPSNLVSKTLVHRPLNIVTRGGGSRKRRVKKKVRRTRKNKKKLSRK